MRILVLDNGVGIPPQKLADIFKPFVSTKGTKGTGLGLAVSRKILREHGGPIINLSSIGGLRGDAAIGVYNTTKAAIVHLTRILAVELGPGVRVNAIAPGLVKTDFARALWEPAGDAVADGLPLRRLGEPEDIAHAARFLAGPGASWITGHTLVVDGGALAGAIPITQRQFAEPEEG